MIKYFNFKQNDTYGSIDYTLAKSNGDPFTIPSGATVAFYLENKMGQVLVNGSAANIVDAASGEVSYNFAEGDLLAFGEYQGEFRVTFSDGETKSFPENGHLLVKIFKSLGGSTTEILIKLTEIDDFKNDITAKVDEQISRVDNLITSTEQASEVVDARGSYPILRDRLDAFNENLADITKQAIGLPDELLLDNPSNPASQLEAFLNTCSNKKVIFPAKKTFILEQQIVVNNVSNLEIDFNGCTLKLPDNCAWSSRTVSGYHIEILPIGFYNCNDIIIKTLTTNGNKSTVSSANYCFGVVLKDVKSFRSIGYKAIDFNYKGVYLKTGTKDIKFRDTTFINGGVSAIPTASDVFVSNNEDDDFYFENTYSERNNTKDTLDIGGQIFYVNGHNGYVKKVIGRNVKTSVDFRVGEHVAEDINLDHCNHSLIVQPYPGDPATDDPNAKPSVTIKNVKAINIYPTTDNGASMLSVIGCKKALLENIELEMAVDATISDFGVLVKESYSYRFPENVHVKNLHAKGMTSGGIRVEKATHSPVFENIVLDGSDSGYVVGTVDSVMVIIKNLTHSKFYDEFYQNNADNILIENDLKKTGTTSQRPLEMYKSQTFNYYDTTLNKPIWLKSAGRREIDQLKITAGAATSGNISITLNGITTTVAVSAGDSIGVVADKIRATTFDGWGVYGSSGSDTVTFKKRNLGTNTAPSFSDSGTTGVTGSISILLSGTNNTWGDSAGTTV